MREAKMNNATKQPCRFTLMSAVLSAALAIAAHSASATQVDACDKCGDSHQIQCLKEENACLRIVMKETRLETAKLNKEAKSEIAKYKADLQDQFEKYTFETRRRTGMYMAAASRSEARADGSAGVARSAAEKSAGLLPAYETALDKFSIRTDALLKADDALDKKIEQLNERVDNIICMSAAFTIVLFLFMAMLILVFVFHGNKKAGGPDNRAQIVKPGFANGTSNPEQCS